MKRVLVTGGAGYIGSHACKALAAAGHEPIVYDNLIYGHRWAVKWGPLVEGDIADRPKLEKAIDQFRPEAVIGATGPPDAHRRAAARRSYARAAVLCGARSERNRSDARRPAAAVSRMDAWLERPQKARSGRPPVSRQGGLGECDSGGAGRAIWCRTSGRRHRPGPARYSPCR